MCDWDAAHLFWYSKRFDLCFHCFQSKSNPYGCLTPVTNVCGLELVGTLFKERQELITKLAACFLLFLYDQLGHPLFGNMVLGNGPIILLCHSCVVECRWVSLSSSVPTKQ